MHPTDLSFEADLTRLELSACRAWRFAACAVVFALVSLCAVAYQLGNNLRFPEPINAEVGGTKHQIDVMVLDEMVLDDRTLNAMVQPMLMVASRRMPGTIQHLRIAVSPEGFPSRYRLEGIHPQAAYVPEEHLFVVDAAAIARTRKPFLTLEQDWAFAMAHEAAHLWQSQRGDLKGHISTGGNHDAYVKDPIELEAFQEGVSVANALAMTGGVEFAWTPNGGVPLFQERPNPYTNLVFTAVDDVADVRLHRQHTSSGILRRLCRHVLGLCKAKLLTSDESARLPREAAPKDN